MVDMIGDPEEPDRAARVGVKHTGELSAEQAERILRPVQGDKTLYAGLDRKEQPVLLERIAEGEGPECFKVCRACDDQEAGGFWRVYNRAKLSFCAGPEGTIRVESWEV
ncbi:hypothetical protein A3A39_00545 [Candidatus Kaiserbacteria bacterium RIFCSPLOWO2_01_FULL_54_13]|uniref:Uncharacterized protein n=1 Tax=Candidatus Kaiserbacteria bacterium RIFCSPLOWO2_01_FULL_54_13 TaxID=1798512 RepID=A0A1F6F0L1_9BACT|nr:MAG: hypothetical protein A3A39_00545 [Candidatus Kaiserbacteria bacterium RIFCSPLOWO2_01_FULL_54_13]